MKSIYIINKIIVVATALVLTGCVGTYEHRRGYSTHIVGGYVPAYSVTHLSSPGYIVNNVYYSARSGYISYRPSNHWNRPSRPHMIYNRPSSHMVGHSNRPSRPGAIHRPNRPSQGMNRPHRPR